MGFLKENNLLSIYQYGLIDGLSIVTQLLSFLSDCINYIVKGLTLDTIYFDFSKAFDMAHRRILKEVTAHGKTGKHSWLDKELSYRQNPNGKGGRYIVTSH